ncbi:DUF1015 family protein [Thermoplasma sp.]|uniref:DUF1015 family protein n=1 Tax=Thermoplasma sp. TaxID=1973142 RepID=UPI001279EEE6|nr:DUF1015 family protein [Thermoplasma sp.]KAA8923138.1 MAG: DUF1015 family protein [Thermoplasma sp.]
MEVRPFRPLIYRKEIDGMISPPFDAITPKQEIELKRNPYNITYLTLPKGKDGVSHAKVIMENWIENGVLIRAERECIIVLRQTFCADKRQINRYGIIAKVRVFPENGDVIPHEMTFEEFVRDRELLMEGIGSQLEPIFLVTIRNELPQYLKTITDGLREDNRYYGPENVENHVYYIYDHKEIQKITNMLRNDVAMVADGHHRLQATKNIAARQSGTAKEFWSYAMSYVTSIHDEGIMIGGVHRVVSNRFKFDVDAASKYFHIDQCDRIAGSDPVVYDGHFYCIRPRENIYDNPIDAINDFLFSKTTGMSILDLERDVIYTHDYSEVVNLVNSGSFSFGVIMPDWDKDHLIKLLLSRKILPQKSTYFYPKIPSGISIDSISEFSLS